MKKLFHPRDLIQKVKLSTILDSLHMKWSIGVFQAFFCINLHDCGLKLMKIKNPQPQKY